MRLEKIAVVVRGRAPGEAIDLGFAMARLWAAPIFGVWLMLVLPIVLALNFLFHEHAWVATILFWWLKPVCDRLPLAVTSRAFFGETPRPLQILRHPRQFMGSGLLAALTFRRFSVWRSYVMPVDALEQLKGEARSNRLGVLGRDYLGSGFLLTATCLTLELVLLASLYLLVPLLWPGPSEAPIIIGDEAPSWAWLLFNGFYFLAVSIIEPFYVAAGFALYINRRVNLEGWDLELGLRRLAQRLGNRGRVAVVATLLFSLVVGTTAAAQPSPPTPVETRAAIREVLTASEFDVKETRWSWRLKNDDPEPSELTSWRWGFLEGLGSLLADLLFWLVVGVSACFVLWLLISLVRGRLGPPLEGAKSVPRPTVLFGLDVRPESLPNDVIHAAREAWQRGDIDRAMSLLYRGALAHVVHRLKVEILASHTEGECIGIVARSAAPELVADFADLTGAWQQTAYAVRPPVNAEFERLCTRWSLHLGGAACA